MWEGKPTCVKPSVTHKPLSTAIHDTGVDLWLRLLLASPTPPLLGPLLLHSVLAPPPLRPMTPPPPQVNSLEGWWDWMDSALLPGAGTPLPFPDSRSAIGLPPDRTQFSGGSNAASALLVRGTVYHMAFNPCQ